MLELDAWHPRAARAVLCPTVVPSGLKRGLRDNTEAFATEPVDGAHLDERAVGAVILVRGEHAMASGRDPIPCPRRVPGPARGTARLQPPRSRGPRNCLTSSRMSSAYVR